ncbi:MAG: LabA-like NYN domain-containing protein [Planctomycetota bacterium]|jgi:uncharacterized LabA/DUF88 family protein
MKVGLFIDAANMFHAQKASHAGFHFDYRKLKDHLCRDSECYRATYYVGEKVPPQAKDQRFLDALRHMGFKIHKKAMRKYIDQETGEETEKANLDIEIAVDMLVQMERYDKCFLCSGDGDFTRAVQFLLDRGKTVVVVATWNMLSSDLYDACSEFVELKDIREDIEKTRGEDV